MSSKVKVDGKNVIITSGAMMATLIGSGFATGQEIIQYFVSYGWLGILGVIGIFIGFAFVGHSFLSVGYDHRKDEKALEKPNDIFKIYAGKVVGTFYYYFAIFFLFLSYSIMIAGSGATITQQFGTPYIVGAGGMLIAVVITVALGLEKLTNILGSLGPLIAISTIAIGTYALITNWGALTEAPALIQQAVADGTIQVASNSWWLAAANYVGFNMIWIAGYLATVGQTSNSRREASLGGLAGAGGFSLAIVVMVIAFMSTFGVVAGAQVPTLVLANNIAPWLGTAFSVIILLGIYTSAVTLLWNVVASFAEDKTTKSSILAVVIGIAGYIVGSLLAFDELVNIIYVLNGYIGIVLIIIMIVRTIQWRKNPKDD